MRQRGIPSSITPELLQVMTAEYKSGDSTITIGKRYGFSHHIVRKHLLRSNCKMRASGEASRTQVSQAVPEDILMEYELNGTAGVMRRWMCSKPAAQRAIFKARGGPKPRKEVHIDKDGYRQVLVTSEWPFFEQMGIKRNKNNSEIRWVREHRKLMADNLNRSLERHETIHHINGNKQDNNLDNLQLKQHSHGAGVSYRCRSCGGQNIKHVEL